MIGGALEKVFDGARTRERPGIGAPPPGVAEEQVFARIREAILLQRLRPGLRLGECALADLFGVKRALVRKVLARLAHDRLVDLRPHRGASVARPSRAESRDLFAARAVLEVAIARSLAGTLGAIERRRLRALVAREQAAYAAGRERSGLALSVEFHRALAALAGNEVLRDFLEELLGRTPLVVLAHRPGGGAPCAEGGHAAIVDALVDGDPRRAEAAVRAHLDALAASLDLREHEAGERMGLAEALGLGRRSAEEGP